VTAQSLVLAAFRVSREAGKKPSLQPRGRRGSAGGEMRMIVHDRTPHPRPVMIGQIMLGEDGDILGSTDGCE
jgi:hypothetical protein